MGGGAGAALRVRNALAFATHEFFQKNGFQYIQTPLISAADCEGGGEVFQVDPS
jgi:asparaginyl-tRNA synthetase